MELKPFPLMQALCLGFKFELSFNSHGRMSSDNHRKSFTPELVQSFTAKVMFVCRQTITAKVSHQNWCKVSQQKSWLYVCETITVVVSYGRLSFNSNAGNNIFSDESTLPSSAGNMLTSVEKLLEIMENCTATFLLQSYQIFDFKSFNCNGTFFVLIYYTIKLNLLIW